MRVATSPIPTATPTAVGSSNQQASTGTTTAQASVVDSSGNIYVVGNATGNFGNQINQGSQDVYLTKYDSAGNAIWSKLVGSAGTASGYGMALDPAGGVVVTGSTTANVTTTSITNGNTDSFVASYDANGNQNWIQQIQTLATNQANAVSVDASGNVYIGGSVSGGSIGARQTSTGTGDAYLAEYEFAGQARIGKPVRHRNGLQPGRRDRRRQRWQPLCRQRPEWRSHREQICQRRDYFGAGLDRGSGRASGGRRHWRHDGLRQSGLPVRHHQQRQPHRRWPGRRSPTPRPAGPTRLSSTSPTMARAPRPASSPMSGTSASDQGGAVTVGPDGTIYLAGTTTGTFAGQQRSVQNVTNAFAAALNANGSVAWTQQYGGASGQSTGAAVAVDPQGSSVLDALGLPRGTIDLNQSVDLTSQTTLRAGDSFQIKIEGAAPRTTTITIGAGETLDSLITKINGELGSAGKASLGFANNAESLQITVNPGQTINLISGPADSDALSRLGIAAGVLSAPAKTSKTSPSATTTNSSSTSSKTTPTYGLGLTSNMDISTKTGADLARSTLLSVMSNIQNIYQKSNATPAAPAVGNTTGTASAQTTAQLASYSLASSLLGTSSNDAVSNIMAIVNGGTAASTSNSNTGISSSSINSSPLVTSLF